MLNNYKYASITFPQNRAIPLERRRNSTSYNPQEKYDECLCRTFDLAWEFGCMREDKLPGFYSKSRNCKRNIRLSCLSSCLSLYSVIYYCIYEYIKFFIKRRKKSFWPDWWCFGVTRAKIILYTSQYRKKTWLILCTLGVKVEHRSCHQIDCLSAIALRTCIRFIFFAYLVFLLIECCVLSHIIIEQMRHDCFLPISPFIFFMHIGSILEIWLMMSRICINLIKRHAATS